MNTINTFSGYRVMWCIVCFDLPTGTKKERGDASKFRNRLIAMGFTRLQFSVYAQAFNDTPECNKMTRLVRAELPAKGEVRLMFITDKQFGKMEVYVSEKRQKVEKAPEQLLLF